MKKKMAVILSLVLACSMSMNVMAAGSPQTSEEQVTDVVISTSAGNAGQDVVKGEDIVISDPAVSVTDAAVGETSKLMQTQNVGASSERSTITAETQFLDAAGNVVDTNSVKLVIEPAVIEQTKVLTENLATAINKGTVGLGYFNEKSAMSLRDSYGKLNILKAVYVSLQDEKGNLLSHNGSIAPAFIENDLVGADVKNEAGTVSGLRGESVTWKQDDVLRNQRLEPGETIQALYRVSGTNQWIALPTVVKNGVVAVAFPPFSGKLEVIFVVSKGLTLKASHAKKVVAPAG